MLPIIAAQAARHGGGRAPTLGEFVVVLVAVLVPLWFLTSIGIWAMEYAHRQSLLRFFWNQARWCAWIVTRLV